jgi:serine phosphatase RsbU (regulator of sigma subunit)/DNA-binding GntR family transcriptional regulator
MTFPHQGEDKIETGPVHNKQPGKLGRVGLMRELFNGGRGVGERMELSEIAVQYQLDEDSVLKILGEFQQLGMVSLSANRSAAFYSPNPKETLEAYEIRAVLEEIGGRAAARVLRGNTAALRCEFDRMRAAFSRLDLESFAEHDAQFHRSILEASGNEVLLRVWDSLVVDLRIRGAFGKISQDFPDVVESHQPILDALEKGRGREAGLLLRNHVETLSEFLRKSESDSGFHRAVTKDLENAKDVQKAFFPKENLSIPGLSWEIFYKPAHSIGGDYYDFFPLQADNWGIAIGDVCGKGIGAALLMASLQASLRAQAMHDYSDLPTLIADVDQLVLAASRKDLYASLFYAEYNSATRVLRYVNAAHNAPMVLRWKDGQYRVFRLESTGRPLGLLEDSQFASQAFQLEIDDVLVMYTDGITEAENTECESWGEERLDTLLQACRYCTPAQIVKRIMDEVSAFAKDRPQSDDMTLVVVGAKDEAETGLPIIGSRSGV